MRKELHTCLSYLSHFGAIAGMASFACCFLEGAVDGSIYGPSFIVLRRSGSTFSCKFTVFSEFKKISYKNASNMVTKKASLEEELITYLWWFRLWYQAVGSCGSSGWLDQHMNFLGGMANLLGDNLTSFWYDIVLFDVVFWLRDTLLFLFVTN